MLVHSALNRLMLTDDLVKSCWWMFKINIKGVDWLIEVRERGHASTNHLTSRILHISGCLVPCSLSPSLEPNLPSALIKSAILIYFRLHRGVLIVWPKYTNETIPPSWDPPGHQSKTPRSTWPSSYPLYLFILFQLISNLPNNKLSNYIFRCGVVLARESKINKCCKSIVHCSSC